MSTPRVVRIIQCSQPGAWYESIEFEDFVVIDSFDQYYVVDTWSPFLDNTVPSLVLKIDCRTVDS